jgi:hypothetical protein
VKVTRLLKLPRSARTIQLVINIPEAASTSPLAPTSTAKRKRPKGWGLVIATFKSPGSALAALASIASVAALVVSIFALNSQNTANSSQQSVNRLAIEQAIQQQAQHVSFTVENSPHTDFGVLSVQNTSSSPISDVAFGGLLDYSRGSNPTVTKVPMWFSLGDLGACQISSINLDKVIESFIVRRIHPNIRQYPYGYGLIGLENMALSFTDRNAISWEYPQYKALQQRTASYTATIVTPTYKNAPVCS